MGFDMKLLAFVAYSFALVCGAPIMAQAGELQTRPLTTVSTSSISGVKLAEPAITLPIDTRFSQSIQTVAFDLGLTCGQIEALGWSMGPTDQGRVDTLFTNTAVELNRLGYTVTPQDPAVAAEDITVYTATKPDDTRAHKLFVWSAGDAGLLLLTCDAKGQLHNTAADVGGMKDDGAATGFGSYQSAPASIDPKKLIGVWEGTYTCRSQGQTGGRLTISRVKASGAEDEHAIEGVLDFFPTPKNPNVDTGSYKVSGTFNSVTQQSYLEPGKWLKQPKDYIAKPIIAYFNVPRGEVSAIFQDTTGCTSFEAHLKAGSAAEAAAHDAPVKKKPKKKKKPAPKPVEPAPDAPVVEPSADEILPQQPIVDTAPAAAATPEAKPETTPETTGDMALTPPVTEAAPQAVEPTDAPAATPPATVTPPAPVTAAPTAPASAPVPEAPKAPTPPAKTLGDGKPTIEVTPTSAGATASAQTATPATAPAVTPPAPAGPITVPNKTDAALDAIDPMTRAKAEMAAGEAARKKAAAELAIPAANEPKPETPLGQ